MTDDLKDKYSMYLTDNNERKNKKSIKILAEVNYQTDSNAQNQNNAKEIKKVDKKILENKKKFNTLNTDENIISNPLNQKKKINLNLSLLKFVKQKMKDQKSQNTNRDDEKEKENEEKIIDSHMSERLNSINYLEKNNNENNELNKKEEEKRKTTDEENKNKLLKKINSKKCEKFPKKIGEKNEDDSKVKINNEEDINKNKYKYTEKDNNNNKEIFNNNINKNEQNKEEKKEQMKEEEKNKNSKIPKNKYALTERNKKKELFPNNFSTKINPPISANEKERSTSIKKDALALLEILKNKKKEEKEETEEKKINQKKDEDIDNKKNERKIKDKNNENCYIKKIDSYNYRPRTKIELFTKQNTLDLDSSLDKDIKGKNKNIDNKAEQQFYDYKLLNNETIQNDNDTGDNNTIKNYFNANNRIIKPFSNNNFNKKFPKINKINYTKPISIKVKERLSDFSIVNNNKTNLSISNDINLESQNINKKKEKVLDKSFDIAKKEITPFTKKILNKNPLNPKIYINKKIIKKHSLQKLGNHEKNSKDSKPISNDNNNNNNINDILPSINNLDSSRAYVKKNQDILNAIPNNNTIDNCTSYTKRTGIYKNKNHLNKSFIKYNNNNNNKNQKANTIETTNYNTNRTGLSIENYNNKKVDTISTISTDDQNKNNKNTSKIKNIKNNFKPNKKNKNEIIFNLEDLMILEERLTGIILALETNENIAHKCFNFWNYYYNCSLTNLIEKIFQNKEDSNIVRLSFNYELISIMVCYEYSFEIDSLSKQIFYLLIELIEINHNNLMIICEYILSKINPENHKNVWVLKLEQIINSSKPYKDFGSNIKYSKNNKIKTIDLNASLLIKKLRYILQKYPTEYSDIYISLLDNLDPLTYEEINNFFRKYILREDNYEGSIVASSYLKKNKYYEPFSPPYLAYPSPKPYTLVLDLDETLVYFKIKSNKEGTLRVRPYLYSFLEEMGHYYELVIWTSATESYANSLIDAIEYEKKYFDFILFREHAIIIDNDFVKDLTRIGRDLDRVIMIDDMPQNFRLQKDNGINIKPFFGDDMDDMALYDLVPILKHIAESRNDVRIELNKYREEIIKKVTSNISKK